MGIKMINNISVIGAGSWGTTIAALIGERHKVNLWVREKELYDIITKERVNKWFMPDLKLPDNLTVVNELDVKDADLIVMGVPSQFMRETAKQISVKEDAIIVSIAKGIEEGTYKRMSQIIREETGNKNIIALSGPNHAEEVSKKMPTATVIASENKGILNDLRGILNRDYFKVYPHDDIIGIEICGAIKNITAIATGVVDGLGFGDNAKGSIITFGLTEMNQFGRFFGAERKTIYGLAGVGDLVATCTSRHSRNRFVGEKIAEGKSFEEIKKEMHGMVAEGVRTTKAVYEFSRKNNIDMPLTSQVYKVLYEKKELKKAISDLITLI